jgi:hypothetical protein
MSKTEKPVIEVPEFVSVLSDLSDGEVNIELTRQLARVVKGCREANRTGAVMLRLSVKPVGDSVMIKADVSAKIPAAAANETVFFAGENGALTREDPRQLELRNLPAAPVTPLRSLGNGPNNPTKTEED